jgi:hypothetical protein
MATLGTRDDDATVQLYADCIDALFSALQSEDIGDLVANAVHTGNLSSEQAERILSVSVWCGSENGAPLHRAIERWLEEASDPVRVRLALAQATFPFRDRQRMEAVLTRVAARYPQFADEIRAMIARRKAQDV